MRLLSLWLANIALLFAISCMVNSDLGGAVLLTTLSTIMTHIYHLRRT